MWVFREVFLLYFCFEALHAIPKKVAILDDETMRITFLLGNSMTVSREKFNLVRQKKMEAKWEMGRGLVDSWSNAVFLGGSVSGTGEIFSKK